MQDPDFRVPTIRTVAVRTANTFRWEAEAYVEAQSDDDVPPAGPRIPRNGRGEAAMYGQALRAKSLVALKENSCDTNLGLLESEAPEGQLSIIPRVYGALFRKIYLKQGGGYSRGDRMSPMDVFLNELEFNMARLRVEDKTTKFRRAFSGTFRCLGPDSQRWRRRLLTGWPAILSSWAGFRLCCATSTQRGRRSDMQHIGISDRKDSTRETWPLRLLRIRSSKNTYSRP